ncbi:phosphoenolpyruvate carboxylase [Artemisia annua]|uniref:Phosphoenolpyruvate carboxylase n=1 Tax=Artemisia annua TaxID=35608 RepID=A0A2U1KYB4_ARTAN|nr:phosphoenolpyruvate carboxylase [Artemisia annua]
MKFHVDKGIIGVSYSESHKMSLMISLNIFKSRTRHDNFTKLKKSLLRLLRNFPLSLQCFMDVVGLLAEEVGSLILLYCLTPETIHGSLKVKVQGELHLRMGCTLQSHHNPSGGTLDEIAVHATERYRYTPELEYGRMNRGSRPSKQKPCGGIESLRAIPWLFMDINQAIANAFAWSNTVTGTTSTPLPG